MSGRLFTWPVFVFALLVLVALVGLAYDRAGPSNLPRAVATPTPAVSATRGNVYDNGVDAQGWPIGRQGNAIDALVIECGRAQGIDPHGAATAKQLREWMTCVDLIRAAVAKSK